MAFSAQHPIAYFCAEYGLESRLPLYAGGLGILAGDTLKAAADAKLPMVGVGLLYRGEKAIQHITEDGWQEDWDMQFDPYSSGLEHVYVDEMPLFVKVHLSEIEIWVRCWKKQIGETVTLYLLDTDTDQNHLSERTITHELYGGSQDTVLKQQMILGIGGVKLLHALGIHPAIYHLNEGRPTFLHWQLIREYMGDHGFSFEEAKKVARAKTVYTNHTLVAAGNQSYPSALVRLYGRYYAEKMGIGTDTLLQDGIEGNPDAFNVTRFALNVSCKASAVSQVHFDLSKKQWPEYNWVGITNGVHLPTWQCPEIRATQQDASQLWQAHLQDKQQLAEYVKYRTGYTYDPTRLVITWARRMAGYKQVTALFSDLERLEKIVRSSERPVQILIAGKAHQLDQVGKETLQQIIGYMQRELSGHALFIPNYDIDLAKNLVQGSDIWLNTPEPGKEACGTSGMKASSNGALQCTTLDGWTLEVDWYGKGWVLDPTQLPESIYSTLEDHVIPLYYQTLQGENQHWVSMMQNSISMAEGFSAAEMLSRYVSLLYNDISN